MPALVVPPPPTPAQGVGWARVVLPSGRAYLVWRTGLARYAYVPERPTVARDAAGRPRVALTLLLSRTPPLEQASITPWVIGGSLALACTLVAGEDDLRALQARVGGTCTPAFVRAGAATLHDAQATYARADMVGVAHQIWLGCALPAAAALDVLDALNGAPSSLRVGVSVELPFPAPPVTSIALDALLGGVLDGLEPSRYVSAIVPHADGTSTPVPVLVRQPADEVRQARDAPAPVTVVRMGERATALAFAMSPSTVAPVSAAALVASGATGAPVRIGAHTTVWLGIDAQFGLAAGDAPTEHFPRVDDPAAPYWRDALDASRAWYAPELALVAPAPADDPETAAFAFDIMPTGIAMGSGGATTGIEATARFTLSVGTPAATTAALAGQGAVTAQPIPLGNLAAALEVTYRQSGSTDPIVQRFPGTVSASGDRLTITVPLLDDWARLAYAALAYPPAAGIDPPRLVIDYAFVAYQLVRLGAAPGELHLVAMGKIQQLLVVPSRDRLPADASEPVLVADERTVVGAEWSHEFRKEPRIARGTRPAAIAASHLATSPIALGTHLVAHPIVVDLPPQRLVARSIAREERVDLAFPCGQFGSFYRQRSADGTATTAIGCQQALALGTTTAKAFEEIAELRTAEQRVYRSLQQPGRFMVLPAGYRVGRFASTEGEKAFRPMLLMYGELGADRTTDRYCIAATLIPDVNAAELARLASTLRAQLPPGVQPVLVWPTDPFVGATTSFAWAVPAPLAAPAAITVVDSVSVTFGMPFDDALLVSTMIDQQGIAGSVTFTLPDGTALASALTIDDTVIGPPDTGPVAAAVGDADITLTNRTAEAMNVVDVVMLDASGAATPVPVSAPLAPGATLTVAKPPGTVSAIADARIAAPVPLAELDIFVEDVTVVLTYIDQLTFANHGLTALAVRARMKGSDHVEETPLAEGATAAATFTLPITSYVSSPAAQYALVETRAEGTTQTDWRDWDLTKGTVLGVTAELL